MKKSLNNLQHVANQKEKNLIFSLNSRPFPALASKMATRDPYSAASTGKQA
jgi:hypothetical protein